MGVAEKLRPYLLFIFCVLVVFSKCDTVFRSVL